MTGAQRLIIGFMIITTWLVCCLDSISAERVPCFFREENLPQFLYATPQRWQYLRIGLNYLESPQPLKPPESVSPAYVHPDLRGFGAYGLSPEAYEDVQRLYPFFRAHSWEQILCSGRLYELANQAFADWLLKDLLKHLPADAGKEEIFDALQQAWNLGLSGFKQGRRVVASRMRRAEEFKQRVLF
jgi:hypothetical protein